MEVLNLDNIACPSCRVVLKVRETQIFNYDPIVLVEEKIYICPRCGYEEKIEYLRKLKEQA